MLWKQIVHTLNQFVWVRGCQLVRGGDTCTQQLSGTTLREGGGEVALDEVVHTPYTFVVVSSAHLYSPVSHQTPP